MIKNTGVAAWFDAVVAQTKTPISSQTTTPDAEAVLGQSKSRFRWSADTTPVLLWGAGTDKLCTYFNKPWLHFTGRSLDSELGNGWAEGVHPEDLQRCLDTYTQSFDRRGEFSMEYRLRRYDGEYRWVLDIGVPRFDQDGSFVGYIGIAVDVTDRKPLEETLRESEARFLDLAEQSRTTHWEVDPQGLFTYVSHVSEASWGYRPDEVVGRMHFYDLHPEEGHEAFKAAVFAVVERKQPFRDVVHAIETKDRRIAWGSSNGIPLLNADGTLGGYRGSCTDITERKRAEEALRASEERLRLAQQAAGIGAFERDLRTEVVTWSTDMEPMYGLPQGTFDGATTAFFRNLIHPDDRATVIELADCALKTGQPTRGEWRVLWPDESIHWIAGRWQVFMDESGEPSRVAGVNMDVTERKRTEDALRESEDKLRLLLDSIAEAIYGIDLELRCTFCNPACLRILGYERIDQVLGKHMHHLLHHSRADGTLFPIEECRVHRVTQTREGVHAEDEVFWRANGKSFPVEYWSYPQQRGQELVGAVVAFTDITERKLAEAALANVNRRLIEAHEQERTRIGRDLHDDVVQRLALLSIELEGVQGDVPDAASELRSRIGALRSQTTQITNDIQLLSHELHSSKLEYLGVVEATKNFCKEFGEHQRVEIDFQSHDVPTALPTELSLSLFRVLQEALRNATKHSGVKSFEVRPVGKCARHSTDSQRSRCRF